MSRLSQRAWRRSLAVLALAVLAVGLLAACASDDAPPRSPLDDGGPDPAAPPGVGGGTPPPFPGEEMPSPTATPTATGTPEATPPDEERVVGQAIDYMAEWLNIPAFDLEVVSIEAVDWSSACTGIERPGLACAQVITPGHRVELQTLLRASVHVVHTSNTGRFAWAPQLTFEGVIDAIDPVANIVDVEVDGEVRQLLIVPGSDLEPGLATLEEGMEVSVGADPIVDGEAIVWLVAQ